MHASIAEMNQPVSSQDNFLITNLGFPTRSQTAIDREADNNIDQQFNYTQPYTVSNTYNTGSHKLVLQTLGG